MDSRLDLINFLISKYDYSSYLEIGVAGGEVFSRVNTDFKIGVDPDRSSEASMFMESDSFFDINNRKFDLIFIDGLHQHEQVYKDIMNSLDALNAGGTIVCHDMWPESDYEASHEPVFGNWNGDCYKALLKIAGESDNLLIHVLYDFDFGTTIIRKTEHNKILERDIANWDVDVETWHKMAFDLKLAMSVAEYEKKSEEVVICAIAKQENNYLEDWCRWHLELGFDRIYIYDNNDADSPECYEWLREKFENVEIRRIRGEKAQQILQYKTFCDDNIYKWVAFIDIDEYINIRSGVYDNIRHFLESFPDKDAFILQWRCFHANPDVSPIDKPIYQYCTEPISDKVRKDCRPENMNGWYKTISRSGMLLRMNEHTVWSEVGKSLNVSDCLGNAVSCHYFKWRDGGEDTVWVNHYIIKNIKDYYYNKYRRGHAGLDMKCLDGYTWWNWNQNINYFADIQGPLSETEQKFLMSRGMKPDWIFRPRATVICHWEPISAPWYSSRKCELAKIAILPHSDSEFILCGDPSLNEGVGYYGELDFLCRSFYYPVYGSCWMPEVLECETYGQPQLVFNMGYDPEALSADADGDRLDILNSTLNSFFRIDITWREICERVIESPGKLVTVAGAIEYDSECAGYRKIVDGFLSRYGYENRGIRIRNNTYMTSREVYMDMRDKWLEFANIYGYIYTSDIIGSYKNGNATLYDAWQFVYPSLVPELEIIS